MSKYAFGVDVGGTTVKLGLFNDEGQVLDKWEIPTVKDNGGEKVLPDIAASIKNKMQEKSITAADLVGVGIGAPGAVNADGFMVNGAVNIGWGSFDLAETLKKELDYMETYLQIQRIRFGSRFNYEIHMQEGFDPNHYMILPILLQPIVENAILHGMEQVEENGLISVSMEAIPAERMSADKTSRGTTDASETGGRLKICISDNGCGMTEEELEALQIKISQKTLNRKSSIGLCNINQRIRLCHGEE